VEPNTGADVMKRIATPLLGGKVSSVLVILVVYPAIDTIRKGWGLEDERLRS
jgi:Cu(I)/Ag(I) efflux system membrane protein CusA/SilA